MISFNKLPASTLLLAMKSQSIRFTKVLSDLQPPQPPSEPCKTSQLSINLAANNLISDIKSRISPNPLIKPLNLTISRSKIDISKPKNDLSALITRIQTQIESLSTSLNQRFDVALELTQIDEQHQTALISLKSTVEEAKIASKSDFSVIETELSSIETTLRRLQVHLASLKSRKTTVKRPVLKLFHILDEEDTPYLAVYNRSSQAIVQATMCTVTETQDLQLLFHVGIDPYVTLLDLSMFEADLRQPICVLDGETVISNKLRLAEKEEGLDLERFAGEKGPMDGGEFGDRGGW